MAYTDARTDHASTAELVNRLSEQVTTLVRDESVPARLKTVEKGGKVPPTPEAPIVSGRRDVAESLAAARRGTPS